jgi:hypothetical protein
MKASAQWPSPINGLQLYHEAHGDLGGSKTVPLLLIPGPRMEAILPSATILQPGAYLRRMTGCASSCGPEPR